jgi:MerR family transcriptional regulator/heat shock protein HspR
MGPEDGRVAEVPRLDDPVISIGLFAERAGLSISAIRRYEDEGLLLAHRTSSGHRLYSHEDLQRVEVIQHLIQDLGLNFEGIRRMEALLPCWKLLPCDEETRRTCPAYQDTTGPCWINEPDACSERGRECRTCVAYRLGSLCVGDIKHLLHDPAECRSTDRRVCEFHERVSEVQAPGSGA